MARGTSRSATKTTSCWSGSSTHNHRTKYLHCDYSFWWLTSWIHPNLLIGCPSSLSETLDRCSLLTWNEGNRLRATPKPVRKTDARDLLQFLTLPRHENGIGWEAYESDVAPTIIGRFANWPIIHRVTWIVSFFAKSFLYTQTVSLHVEQRWVETIRTDVHKHPT